MNKKEYDIVIIGGGIIGTMTNYYLSKYKLNVLQLEKNNYLADETTQGNSGVLHGGFDAEHPVEVKLNILGTNLWKEEILPKFKKIPRMNINSLVLAFGKEEENEIQKLYNRGIKNNLKPEDISVIGKKEIFSMEPNINQDVTKALLCRSSVVIDPVIATKEIARSLENSSDILTSSKVTNITRKNNKYIIEINNDYEVIAKNIINASGHFTNLISQMADEGTLKLTTRRGEYRVLSKEETHKVNSILFKVPSIYGKGVIVSPMPDGRTLVGPTAEDGVDINDTRLVTQEKFKLIAQIGTKIIPTLDLNKTERVFSGSRPIYIDTNDFHIAYGKNKEFINLAGIKSPGLSSSPAIALEAIRLLKNNNVELKLKNN